MYRLIPKAGSILPVHPYLRSQVLFDWSPFTTVGSASCYRNETERGRKDRTESRGQQPFLPIALHVGRTNGLPLMALVLYLDCYSRCRFRHFLLAPSLFSSPNLSTLSPSRPQAITIDYYSFSSARGSYAPDLTAIFP